MRHPPRPIHQPPLTSYAQAPYAPSHHHANPMPTLRKRNLVEPPQFRRSSVPKQTFVSANLYVRRKQNTRPSPPTHPSANLTADNQQLTLHPSLFGEGQGERLLWERLFPRTSIDPGGVTRRLRRSNPRCLHLGVGPVQRPSTLEESPSSPLYLMFLPCSILCHRTCCSLPMRGGSWGEVFAFVWRLRHLHSSFKKYSSFIATPCSASRARSSSAKATCL